MSTPIKHRGKWRIRWTDENGNRHSEVFAERRDAVFQLRRRVQEVEEVRRGLRLGTPPKKTVNDLLDYWLTKRSVLKRSRGDDESIIRAHLRPAFGAKLVKDIGVSDCDEYMAARTHLHKNTIAHHITLLISLFRMAVELGWIVRAPKFRKPRIRLFTKDYQYLRTQDEIRRFLLAAQAEGDQVASLFATAVYSGMREGELAALQWHDVDLVKRLITVQRSWDGPTKAEDVRYVPILDPLLPVLRDWRLRSPGALVFPNQAGKMHGEAAQIFQEVLHRVLDAAGFPRVERNGKPRRYITFHGLRHTFASHWMMGGGDIFRLSKVLGHKSVQMTHRYAHLAPAAFAGDYGRLGTTPPFSEGAEVIPLPAPAVASAGHGADQ